MRVDVVVREMMDVLATGNDAELNAAIDKFDQLRRRTAGDDRMVVIDAIQECRQLLTPAGQLRRAVALAVRQSQAGMEVNEMTSIRAEPGEGRGLAIPTGQPTARTD